MGFICRREPATRQRSPRPPAAHSYRHAARPDCRAIRGCLVEGIRKNHDDAAYKALKPCAVDGFRDALLALRSAPEGTVVDIDQLADGRTRLSVDGKQQGQDIEGSDSIRPCCGSGSATNRRTRR